MLLETQTNTHDGILLVEKRVETEENASTSILILTLLKLAWVGNLIHLVDRFLKERSTAAGPAI